MDGVSAIPPYFGSGLMVPAGCRCRQTTAFLFQGAMQRCSVQAGEGTADIHGQKNVVRPRLKFPGDSR
eukprot:1237859-Prorocentrum_lima.AAC.1